MNSAPKEKIDALWMETRLGQCILLVADGKWEEAKEIDRQAFNEGFVHGVFAEEKEIEEKNDEAGRKSGRVGGLCENA